MTGDGKYRITRKDGVCNVKDGRKESTRNSGSLVDGTSQQHSSTLRRTLAHRRDFSRSKQGESSKRDGAREMRVASGQWLFFGWCGKRGDAVSR